MNATEGLQVNRRLIGSGSTLGPAGAGIEGRARKRTDG